MNLFIVLIFGVGAVSAGQSDNFLKRFKNYLTDVWDDVASITEAAAIVVKFIDSYPLLLASSRGDSEAVIKRLTNKRINVDFTTPDGTTALMEAASYGKYEMVKMLIDRGARINHKNKYGFSAYDYAMRAGHEDIMQLLESGNKDTEMAIYEPLTYGSKRFTQNSGGIPKQSITIAFLVTVIHVISLIF